MGNYPFQHHGFPIGGILAVNWNTAQEMHIVRAKEYEPEFKDGKYN